MTASLTVGAPTVDGFTVSTVWLSSTASISGLPAMSTMSDVTVIETLSVLPSETVTVTVAVSEFAG